MRHSTTRVLLGMLSGGLITVGVTSFQIIVYVMRMINSGSGMTDLEISAVIPLLFLLTGSMLGFVSLKSRDVPAWRTIASCALMLVPLFVLGLVPLVGVLMGSLGMAFHWNGSREWGYLTLLAAGLVITVCSVGSVKLAQTQRR